MPAVYLEWTSSTAATAYDLIRDDGQHTSVSLLNVAYDTNVAVGGPARSYFIRATDGSGGTTDSNTVTVAPPPTACSLPPAPFTITGKALCYPGDPTRVMGPAEQLDWSNARYATSYDVYKNGNFYHAIAGGGDLYSFIGFPVVGGSTNSYYVVAKNAAGTTNSNTVTFTIPADICAIEPPVPVLSSATAVCSSQTHQPVVALRWTVVPAAFGWQLYRDGTPYATPHGLSYTDTNVLPGHTYTYNIATYGLSAPLSNPITVTVSDAVCPLSAPVITPSVICDNDNTTVVHLGWTSSPNAASYTIMRDATVLATGLAASGSLGYFDRPAATGATYSYRVIAVNGSGSASSSPVTVNVIEMCPPGLFTTSAAGRCVHSTPAIQLTWSQSARAASYSVLRDHVQISGALPATAREFIDDSASLGYHAYDVKASNARSDQLSGASIVLSKALCGSVPDSFTATVRGFCNQGTPAVRVEWSEALGASSYAVSRDGVILPGTNQFAPAWYEDTTTMAGQTYTYAVIASNPNGTTTMPAGTITPSPGYCPPGPLTVSAITGCEPAVTLFWTAATNNVVNYAIFRDQVLIATMRPDILTYADNYVLLGVLHDYFIRAAGTGGMTDSNVAHVRPDQAPCVGATPDLTAIDIKPSALSARGGDTLTVNVDIVNRGTATAMASTARIRFGRGPSMSSSDAVLATFALPVMDFGADIQRPVIIKLPAIASGTYYLFLTLDEEHVSGDDDLGDNVKISAPLNVSDMIPPRRRAAGH
ncbi:MAG TPA: hypothetical protein VGQ46_20000 [Thermoanaerobaculia bacterium]|nr:hypothetical protein [Thermoanaerobaculia bacterium]